ncbi:MAG: ATP-binding cassette domain-containing protein [Myxococcota bacterium]
MSFAVDFARLLAQILTARDYTPRVRIAMRSAIKVRTKLADDQIDTLLDLALTPEQRVAIDEDQLRAFGRHFGTAESEALRLEVAREVDLRTFAARYEEKEALRLLDSLFFICAVDGRIDADEIRRLDRAAQQLEIDQALINALFRKHDGRHHKGEVITLDQGRYIIGRAPHHRIPLPDPQIALRHAELVRVAEGWRVSDLNSGRPTVVNGHPRAQATLRAGDELRLGTTTLRFLGDRQVRIRGTASFSSLSVRNLNRSVRNAKLLDDISFTVFTGELVAIVGPSGAGKTSLVNAIAGLTRSTGQVLFGTQSFHRMIAHDRSVLGMVPQDDVLHTELTVEESLRYAGKLRLGRKLRRQELATAIDRVALELELEPIRGQRVGNQISGGQRKRVNVGHELLSRNNRVLFLDEPTSGLDPQTSQGMVALMRQLADDGRIVFMATHDVTPAVLSKVDHLLVIAKGGRLAWFGPPQEATRYFGVASADRIFGKLAAHPDADWGARYRTHSAFRRFVRTREHLVEVDGIEAAPSETSPVGRDFGRDLLTLTERYLLVKLRDVSGLAVLLAQAPVLGLFLWAVFPGPDVATMFMIALSCLWFGLSASVRELISDRSIALREAEVGVSTAAYLGSKVLVLGGLVTLQCTVLASMGYGLLGMGAEAYGYSWAALCGVSSLTGLVGVSIGLWVSSRMPSSEAAVGTLPLILIPQITFGGLLVRVSEMNEVARALSSVMVLRYAFEAVLKTGIGLTEYQGGRLGRDDKHMVHLLKDLGFRTSDAADYGIPMAMLVAVLGGVAVGLLLWTYRRLVRRVSR